MCVVGEAPPDLHPMLIANSDCVVGIENAGHAGDSGGEERLPAVPDCTQGSAVDPELALDRHAQYPALLSPEKRMMKMTSV